MMLPWAGPSFLTMYVTLEKCTSTAVSLVVAEIYMMSFGWCKYGQKSTFA